MKLNVKVACIAIVAAVLVHQTLPGRVGASETIRSDGVLVHAALNQDGDPEHADVVESSVAFVVNIPFARVSAHMFDQGTLARISPDHCKVDKVEGPFQTPTELIVKSACTITPLKVAFISLTGEKKLYLVYRIDKQALKEGILDVKIGLDPDQKSDFTHFSQRLRAMDLHNGSTMAMVTSSTRSTYNLPPTIRLQLAKRFLEDTRTHIVDWCSWVSTK